MRYLPEVDGLRAFAVIPVILFHMEVGGIPGGFAGVDVFFVISGFLITSILLKELREGTFTFKGFWARRIRRILPAMLLVVASILLVAYFFGFRGDCDNVAKSSMAAILSYANIFYMRGQNDYWGPEAHQSPLLHTWSLSVEEQFYLFFPLAIWLIHRYFPRWLQSLLLGGILLSLALFLYGVTVKPIWTFYLLPMRAWELGTGCFVATVFPRLQSTEPHSRWSAFLGVVGLGLVVASYFLVQELGSGLILAVSGASLVIAFARSGPSYWILSRPLIVYIGKISYSLYLWHWPVLLYAKFFELRLSGPVIMVVIFALSLVSYYLVEKPTRRRPGVIPWILAAFLLTLGFAIYLRMSDLRYDSSGFNQVKGYEFYDLYPGVRHAPLPADFVADLGSKPENRDELYLQGGFITGSGTPEPEIVVLGDSNGFVWSEPIRRIARELHVKAAFCSMHAISPLIEVPPKLDRVPIGMWPRQKLNYDQARLRFLQEWKPKLVVICKRWANPNNQPADGFLEYLDTLGAKVLLVEQPPELAVGNRNVMQYLIYKGVTPKPGVEHTLPMNVTSSENARRFVSELASRHPNARVVPTFDLFARGSQVLVLDGRSVLYRDDDHLTEYGSARVYPRLEKLVRESLSEPANE